MKTFEEKKFAIPQLKGLSEKSVSEHLKLYAGYVKNSNGILEAIESLSADPEKNTYTIGELQRRFGFEFDGMRNHEYYFESLCGGPKGTENAPNLQKAIAAEWGDFDAWLKRFKALALTRGVGWAILYYDPSTKRLLNAWIDEQHLGHLTGLSPILALDMWEHSFVFDYQPSGKKNYVEDFFANLNWSVIESNFTSAASR